MFWEYLWDQVKRLCILVIILAIFFAVGMLGHSVRESRSIESQETRAEYEYEGVEWYDAGNSSAFTSIGFDGDADRLIVVFRNSGKAYLYSDFPASEFRKFIGAESLGAYYNKYIKGQYPSMRCPDFDE